jgi:hypothetical protein
MELMERKPGSREISEREAGGRDNWEREAGGNKEQAEGGRRLGEKGNG